MKIFFQAFCFLLISSVGVADSYAESYRVRGEVSYEKGQAKWTRTITSDVISGVPIIIEQGEQIISFVFIVESPPSNKYSLTASLLTNPNSADGLSVTVLTDTFQSRLVGGENGPFEFEMEQNGIRVGGAVGVSLKR